MVVFIIILVVIGIIAIAAIAQHKSQKEREGKLLAEAHALLEERNTNIRNKYPDPEVHNKIINQEIWMGETKEMVIDSLGKPQDIDTKVTKTKTVEVIKYNRAGANRYNTKITIENGLVAGWDVK